MKSRPLVVGITFFGMEEDFSFGKDDFVPAFFQKYGELGGMEFAVRVCSSTPFWFEDAVAYMDICQTRRSENLSFRANSRTLSADDQR